MARCKLPPLELIGLDVGFSAERPSSGVARLWSDGSLHVAHTTSTWQDRSSVIGATPADVAAIDAPYTTAEATEHRGCERVFTLGQFQRRCKPGASHVPGTGRQLRAAGWETAQQLKAVVPWQEIRTRFPRIENCNIVEAFPNAYLGVCVGDASYQTMRKLRRGRKFDWLYDEWVGCHLFERLTEELRLSGVADLANVCNRNKQHDQRAALVCLLTAAGVFAGQYTAVGDDAGGYLFLPPWQNWATWAVEGLDRQRQRVPGIEVWVSGNLYEIKDALPGTGNTSSEHLPGFD